MAKDSVIHIRASREEAARWAEAAHAVGWGSMSPWARKVLNDECDRADAEARRAEAEKAERKRLHDTVHGYY